MSLPDSRRDLISRLQYTFLVAEYDEIDSIVTGLRKKENFGDLCAEFFLGSRINDGGYLIPSGFFGDAEKSASMTYAMYQILAFSPDTFLLKHRVVRVQFQSSRLSDPFRLPPQIFGLPSLKALSARSFGITRLPNSIRRARCLRRLDLGCNRIERFPTGVLGLPQLAALNLSYNILTALPGDLEKLQQLRVLNLRGNRLQSLPDRWHRLQNLCRLDLSMNRLDNIPDSLRTMTSLIELRLAYNVLPASVEAQWEEIGRSGLDPMPFSMGG